MKKILIVYMVIIILVAIAGYFVYIYNSNQFQYDISDLPEYYKTLANLCIENSQDLRGGFSVNCCLESVIRMSEGEYKLIYIPYPGEVDPKPECPDDFFKNSLKCPNSFSWCEPVELD